MTTGGSEEPDGKTWGIGVEREPILSVRSLTGKGNVLAARAHLEDDDTLSLGRIESPTGW